MSYVEERDLGAERCDLAWENANSEASRERWYLERQQLAAMRRAERESKPLHTRLYDVGVALTSLPTQRAGNIAAQSPSADGSGNTPHVDEFAIGYFNSGDIRRHVAIIKRAVVALEEAIEVARFGSLGTEKPMIAEEKDARIRELSAEGLTPDQISQLDPNLGTPRVVEKVLNNEKV